MSFLTGTNTEVIAASAQPVSASPVTTAYTSLFTAANAAYLPIGFFGPTCVGKTLRCVVDGYYTTTGAVTSYQMGMSLDSALGTVGTLQVGASGAVIPTVSVTAGFWRYDCEITVSTQTQSLTAASNFANVVGMGLYTLSTVAGPGIGTAGVYPVGTSTVVAVPPLSAYFLELVLKSSAGTASQTMTVERSTIYGCN